MFDALPSCPAALSPQQYAVPLVVTPHAAVLPALTVTKANSTIAIDILYALNRKYLEKAPRYFFVPEPVKIHIKGCPELEAKMVRNWGN